MPRPQVTPELLEEYCRRFRNWGKWGPDDEIGTLNYITPAKVVEAARLVRQGKILSLALPFDSNGPQTGRFGRVNPIHQMVATGTDHVAGNQRVLSFETAPYGWGYADDMITMYLQTGTQWDGLSHIFHRGKMWNGYDARLVNSSGAARNGIERMKDKVVTRGVLLDIARLKGVEYLKEGEAIYAEDLGMASTSSCSWHRRFRSPARWVHRSTRSRSSKPPSRAATSRVRPTSQDCSRTLPNGVRPRRRRRM